MLERIKFQSPEEKKEQEIAENLKKEGGIFYREETDPETSEKKRFVNILGVEVETYASREDIEKIKEEIVFSKLDQILLRTIVECYKLRQPLMVEGDPGVGKTFLMKKFVQLIHGKEAPILELVGTPRTSELEILGHWAPAAHQKELKDPVVLDTLRRYDQLETEYRQITDEFDKKHKEIRNQFNNGDISKEIADQRIQELVKWFNPLQERYTSELQSLVQRTTLTGKVEWEFKEGALLQAYLGKESRGYVLIVDEFNLIPSNYQQIFLQIGGEKGALSDSISYWGNTGKTIYRRGKDTWICFASNYPEKTPGRSEVVAPVTDRLAWKAISSEEAETKKQIIRKTAGGRLKTRQKELTRLLPEIAFIPVEKGLEWDKVLDEELGKQIADFVDLLDNQFTKYYQEVGDNIEIRGEKRRRTQQFEFSGRNPLRLFSYLDHFQVRNPETGLVDIPKTLKNAFERYYLDRLADPERKEAMQVFFRNVMEPSNIEVIKESEETLKTGGRVLPPGAVMFEGKIMSCKEVLDILAERASMTEEERRRLEEDLEKRVEQARRDAKDALESILTDPNVSEKIKKLLEEDVRNF